MFYPSVSYDGSGLFLKTYHQNGFRSSNNQLRLNFEYDDKADKYKHTKSDYFITESNDGNEYNDDQNEQHIDYNGNFNGYGYQGSNNKMTSIASVESINENDVEKYVNDEDLINTNNNIDLNSIRHSIDCNSVRQDILTQETNSSNPTMQTMMSSVRNKNVKSNNKNKINTNDKTETSKFIPFSNRTNPISTTVQSTNPSSRNINPIKVIKNINTKPKTVNKAISTTRLKIEYSYFY